jgi:hypothetical protein
MGNIQLVLLARKSVLLIITVIPPLNLGNVKPRKTENTLHRLHVKLIASQNSVNGKNVKEKIAPPPPQPFVKVKNVRKVNAKMTTSVKVVAQAFPTGNGRKFRRFSFWEF